MQIVFTNVFKFSSLSDKEQSGARTLGRRKGSRRKRDAVSEVEAQQKEAEDEIQPEMEIDRELDRELENKSRQHNLTSANVRSIIHVSVDCFLKPCADIIARFPQDTSYQSFLRHTKPFVIIPLTSYSASSSASLLSICRK